VQEARTAIASAVLRMQGELQAELHDDEIRVHDVLGRGGFGIVYRGVCRGLLPRISYFVD
jgi:hypothetical protein